MQESREQLDRKLFEFTVELRSCLYHFIYLFIYLLTSSSLRFCTSVTIKSSELLLIFRVFVVEGKSTNSSYLMLSASIRPDKYQQRVYFFLRVSQVIVFCVFTDFLFSCYLAVWLLLNKHLLLLLIMSFKYTR